MKIDVKNKYNKIYIYIYKIFKKKNYLRQKFVRKIYIIF